MIMDCITAGIFSPEYVGTDMSIDVMTKALDKVKHRQFTKQLLHDME